MDRYRAEYPRDDASAGDGDTQFMGVNMKLSPEQLPPGMVREAINKTFVDGTATTRGGAVTVAHFNPRLAGLPNVTASEVITGTPIWGCGQYADAAGEEWMLIAWTNEAWRLRDGATPEAFQFPEPLSAECSLVQFANQVYLFRGPDLAPWRWDGTPGGIWAPTSQLDPADSTTPIPGAVTAEVIGDRLLIPTERDGVIFSDLEEGQYYDAAQTIRVNRGTNDSLVRLFPYANGAVLAFKTRSVYLIENAIGDLSNLTITDVSRVVGCVARRAVTQVGADVWFLGGDGVYRVSQVIQDRIQTEPVAVSDAMAPFFRTRVNWAAIAGACAISLAEYYFLALPIDGANGNNAILRCNTATGNWEGWWTFSISEEHQLGEFCAVPFRGRRRLFVTHPKSGLVSLLEEGAIDYYGSGAGTPISDSLVTRGYLVGSNDTKQFTRAAIDAQTWRGNLTLSLDTGHGPTQIASRQKHRRQYYIFGRADYDVTNAHDDAAAPDRQSYHIPLQDAPVLHSGLPCVRLQRAEERIPTRTRGRWASLSITNAGGICRITETSVEARQVNRSTRTQP